MVEQYLKELQVSELIQRAVHGDTRYFLADETDDEDMYFEMLSKASQFSYPITIATADQLVTSVFKYNGF